MEALLVSNPIASTVTPDRLRVVVRALESAFDLEVASTQGRGHATQLAADAAASGAKAIIAFGGDGTVHEVVNGLLADTDASDVVLGALPGGGTNVLSRNLGFPTDLVEATGRLLDLAERGSTRRIGAGRLRAEVGGGAIERAFVLGAGLCLDAETVRRVDESGLRPRLGDLAFVYCGFRGFFSIRRHDTAPLRVETTGGPEAAWWASIACSDPYTYWGRRAVRVAPNASLDAGLDLVAARSAGFFRTLRWLRQALGDGRHIRDADIIELRDRPSLCVESTTPIPLQADGEFLGQTTRLDARRLPSALLVLG